MAFREYRRPTDCEWNPEDLTAYLTGKGFMLGPGGVGTGIETAKDGSMVVLVRVDLDANLPADVVTKALDAYTPPADPLRTARVYLLKRAKELSAMKTKDRTQADNDLAAVLTVLGMGG